MLLFKLDCTAEYVMDISCWLCMVIFLLVWLIIGLITGFRIWVWVYCLSSLSRASSGLSFPGRGRGGRGGPDSLVPLLLVRLSCKSFNVTDYYQLDEMFRVSKKKNGYLGFQGRAGNTASGAPASGATGAGNARCVVGGKVTLIDTKELMVFTVG